MSGFWVRIAIDGRPDRIIAAQRHAPLPEFDDQEEGENWPVLRTVWTAERPDESIMRWNARDRRFDMDTERQAAKWHRAMIERFDTAEGLARLALGDATEIEKAALRAALAWKAGQ
jgi:hypothetical protein